MTRPNKTSSADHADILNRLIFITIFTLSLIYAIETVSYFIEESAGDLLSTAAEILVGLCFVFLFLTIFWKIKYLAGDKRYLLNSEDSFVTHAFNKACRVSWKLTFVLLTVITVTISRESSAFPAQYYINLVQFLMTASFSISFFYYFRDSDADYILEEVR